MRSTLRWPLLLAGARSAPAPQLRNWKSFRLQLSPSPSGDGWEESDRAARSCRAAPLNWFEDARSQSW